jgi:hypothetical protein
MSMKSHLTAPPRLGLRPDAVTVTPPLGPVTGYSVEPMGKIEMVTVDDNGPGEPSVYFGRITHETDHVLELALPLSCRTVTFHKRHVIERETVALHQECVEHKNPHYDQPLLRYFVTHKDQKVRVGRSEGVNPKTQADALFVVLSPSDHY